MQPQAPMKLGGHVLPALTRATGATGIGTQPLNITIVLARDDEAGFQQYLRDVYNAASPRYRQFLSQAQLAARFGPSQQAYEDVANFMASQNFVVETGSANRLTMTLYAQRGEVEHAFGVHIGDYALSGKNFYANDGDPALPASIAPHVRAVLGLSNLAIPQAGPLKQEEPDIPEENLALSCRLAGLVDPIDSGLSIAGRATGIETGATGFVSSFTATLLHYQCAADELDLVAEYAGNAGGRAARTLANSNAATTPGAGQTIALAEFDSYYLSDVLNFLTLIGHPERVSAITSIYLGAGPNFTTQGESEVLLDIDTVLSLAPGAAVRVYQAGFRGQGSFQTMFNAMINDGVSVISNSWAYCEDQTTLADVQSLDAVLQSAAASGITVVTGSGDTGSTCLDGSANTVSVPASAPTITAVGGTTALPGFNGTYGSETWWDGSQHSPTSGQGGFGLSRYFARPTYQNNISAQSMRSVPDVAAPSDPAQGVLLCQGDDGGCPTHLLYGGTSIAAPILASFVAVLNQRTGSNIGFLNPQLYPQAGTNAFHNAAMLSSDFAHVGLGTPNVNVLHTLLSGTPVGAADPAKSAFIAFPDTVSADGTSYSATTALLFDASFNSVSGTSVAITANSGSHAVITAVNATSNVENGAARFTVTDSVVETVTLTAHIGGNALTQTAQVAFIGPPAASGGIVAVPTTQAADGASTSVVTVSLRDAQGHPTPGKQVLLAQNLNSVILGANPSFTDSNGEAQFSVTDQVQETAVYTAIDMSDGNLPLPQSASVTFSGAVANSCGQGITPVAGPGYALSVYASGFPVQDAVSFGQITLHGCVGVSGIAFDAAGNLFASDYVTGDIYKFAPGGGIANAATKLTGSAIGPSLGSLTFGLDGTLYATRVATSNNSPTGAVLKIDTSNGAATTVAPNIPCPSNIATDPLSGDLFVSAFCFGTAPQEDDSIWRIANPGSASPATSTYARSGISPNGSVSFAPDGTLYAVYGYTNFGGLFAGIDRIGATNGTQPAPVQASGATSSFSALAIGNNPAGGTQALVSSVANSGGYAHSVAVIDMTVSPPASGATLVQSDIGSSKILGPDNCVYLAGSNVVYKLSNADGSCPLNNLAPAHSIVLNPQRDSSAVVQGESLRFDVNFPHDTNLPVGTPVTYVVVGANRLLGAAYVGFGGLSFAYVGRKSGTDTVIATAQLGGSPVDSNPVTVKWAAGKHSTYLNLNNTSVSGTIGKATVLNATLLDVTLSPPAPISGADIQFSVAGQSCSATTGIDGVASCALAVVARNECTLSVAFAGDSAYLPATASELFSVDSNDVIFESSFESIQGTGCAAY
ncbi:MAG: protease pro-enzyme activation domain-containing protein [Rudaea sp.]